jgi:hypothetical protein
MKKNHRFLRILLALSIILLALNISAQQIQILTSGTKTSLRGLSVVDDNIIWASGSNGTVAKSTDGGKNFTWLKVAGYEKRDFRDVEAFDSNTAIIMAVAEPAIILKTKDGGKNWYKVFEDTTKGMFLDAMDFDGNEGIVIGDPINSILYSSITKDYGETWIKNFTSSEMELSLISNEAFFASSGTNVIYNKRSKYDKFIMASGGTKSRLIYSRFLYFDLPIIQGKESTGANSIDIYKNKGIVVGGDFAKDKDTTLNCVLIDFNKQVSFSHPQTPPHGYRSCVIYINDKQLITCGTSGIDISNDSGMNWQLISNESFHVVQKAKKGKAVFLAGGGGRIAKYIF